MCCLELALGIIKLIKFFYSLVFDDAGIGSTGTDSLASAATNIAPAMASAYTHRSFIIQHAIY